MGLDYVIQHRKGKDNIATDALSRCTEERMVASIIVVIPNWCQKVVRSYEGDERVKALLEQLIINPRSKQGYTYENAMIRFKGKLVIGSSEQLKKKKIL